MTKCSWWITAIAGLGSTLANAQASGQTSPPAPQLFNALFQDHAVLQRDKPIAVWGQAANGAEITVSLGSASVLARADATGHWSTTLPAMANGGPFTLSAQSSSGAHQDVNDVLIGDVYLCSGQSNMELSVNASGSSWWEIQNSANNTIRMLTVAQTASVTVLDKFQKPVEWQIASSTTVGKWSAACFYFARELQKTVQVPLGLINASWGGSNIRPWISAAGLHAIGGYDPGLETLHLYATDKVAAQQHFGDLWKEWWRSKSGDRIGAEPWSVRSYNANDWHIAPAQLGDYQVWGVPDLAQFTGLLWYRTTIKLSAKQAAAATTIYLGGIDEVDETFLNGKAIGNTFGYGTERSYTIPKGTMRAGENVLVINVTNTWASGGLVGDNSKRVIKFANGESVPLNGEWRYRKAPREYGYPARAPWESVGGLANLYNAMIAPLGNYGVRGALWYQGESNAGEPESYQALLSGLMADWRNRFGADLAFLVVQLPNFGARSSTPTESGWAGVREAERLAVANDAHAGLAVSIDIGDPNNLHPPNKQDIGRRLARAARHVVYGEKISPSGPRPLDAHHDTTGVVVNFGDIEQALIAFSHQGPIGFELCGNASGSCQYADARIDDSRIVLSALNAKEATRIRYCWADSPICTLYDQNGLPAGPFELKIQ